jgi:alpha-N-arabinofuranosidase
MPKLTLHPDRAAHRISRHVYGHFAEHLGRCIYDGLYVGEDSPIPNTRGWRNDIVAALCNLHIPNLRWPGGCFADTYHWKDGIGPKAKRPTMINVHWGGVTENNHVGTHEFLDLCGLLGCEPYIAGNVGSGTVQEMSEWLEYITMPGKSPMADLRRANGREQPWKVKYWGVGNENWGCGGDMRAEYYADLYRQYQCYCRHFSGQLYKVACGFWDDWNDTLLKLAGNKMNGLSVHYYTVPGEWSKKGPATRFSADQYYATIQKALGIDDFLRRTTALLDKHDPQKKVDIIMDEWGTWYDVEPGTNPGFLYQQNTMRDALVAAATFNVFHTHAERLHMANIAQTVNVLQAMVLTEGPRMLLTPTYHIFEMYKTHQNATFIPSTLETDMLEVGEKQEIPHLSVTASRSDAGVVQLGLCNLHPEKPAELPIDLAGISAKAVSARILTASALDTHNTFDAPTTLQPASYDGFTHQAGTLTVKLPAHSVVTVELR